MFWRNNFQNNRNAYHNNNTSNTAPAWSTSRNGQPMQRLQNMLQQAHISQAQQANQQTVQAGQQQAQQVAQPVPQQLPKQGPSLTQQPRQAQQKQQYYDPSVSFEPLSEDMLKLMGQQKETAQEAIAPNPVPQMETPAPIGTFRETPVPTPEISTEKPAPQEIPKDLFTNPYLPKALTPSVISGLMQDEQNGATFYRYLAGKLNDGKQKDALLRIATENERRISTLNEIHKDVAAKGFQPETNTIELNANFRTCLRLAAIEESNIIEKIIGLLEYEKNSKLEMMLYRKLNTVNLLLSL